MNKNALVIVIVIIALVVLGYFAYFATTKTNLEAKSFLTSKENINTQPINTAPIVTTRTTRTSTAKSTPKTSSTNTSKQTTPAPKLTAPKATTTPPTPPVSPDAKLPDLIVENITISPATPTINNSNVEITVTIKNTGQGTLTNTDPVSVTIESDTGFFTEKSLSTTLAPGKTAQVKYKPFLDLEEPFEPGESVISAYINIDAMVEEEDYDNNDKTVTVEFLEETE